MQEWGVRYAIVGIHAPQADLARRQIDVCRNNGLPVPGLYDYLYFGESGEVWDGRRTAIRQVAIDMDVSEIWLDVERTFNEGIAPDVIIRKTENAAVRCDLDSLDWGIYTGLHTWNGMTAHSRAFAHAPLMDASYLNRPKDANGKPIIFPDDIGFSEPYMTSRSRLCHFGYFVSYGGWDRPLIRQAAGTTLLCSKGVDLNWAEPLPL